MPDGPLIVNPDGSVLLEAGHARAEAARAALAPFAELVKRPEHVHTYRLTSLALWNARAAGHRPSGLAAALTGYARTPVPPALLAELAGIMDRYGRLVLRAARPDGLAADGPAPDGSLELVAPGDPELLAELVRDSDVAMLLAGPPDGDRAPVGPARRGPLKQALLALGWPVDDQAGYAAGTPLTVGLRPVDTRTGRSWQLRSYQHDAIEAFAATGSGVVVLPCGAGKTLVGTGAIARLGERALVLVTSSTAAQQWRTELLARTDLEPDQVGEYSGRRKQIAPVTIATYQVVTTRRGGRHQHLDLLDRADWGLIVYDEVHLLPARVFRTTAALQARRRLGLTATLVREDGRAGDVFSLIGPKRYEAPWRELERQGWVAAADCAEVRVDLTPAERMDYALADRKHRYRVAATAASKLPVVLRLAERHEDEQVLVIGQYLDQLEHLATLLRAPLITGQVPTDRREELYGAFRTGQLRLLVVSRVANLAVDLPEASVAIQVSGTFGSRQEEAQRLGRVLRPKAGGGRARFYTVVARGTNDAEYAQRRQRFLAEQGYAYELLDAADVLGEITAAVDLTHAGPAPD